jgi:hypothetical protein
MVMEAGTDPKNNVKKIKWIQRLDDLTVYSFPDECQSSSLHPELVKNVVVARGLNQLLRRGHSRTLAVTLNEELRKLYFDEDDNVCFREIYLDEIPPPTPLQCISTSTQQKSLKSLTKDMVIEKFTGKNQNASVWIATFEKECLRLGIVQSQFAEALRLFVEGGAQDWYSMNLKLLSLTDPWESWKVEFLENFSPKGWSDVTHAYTYRYYSGSLSEFAFKKINLLLDADPSLSVTSRINFVVIGLPYFIKNKLNKADIETQADLISELNNLEHLVNQRKRGKFQYADSRRNGDENNQFSQQNKKPAGGYTRNPCSLCVKAGFPDRYHKDVDCWYHPDNKDTKPYFLNKDYQNTQKPKQIKVANNVELQQVLNEVIPDSKN